MTATPIAIARNCARAIAGGADPVHTIAAAVERYGAHRSGEHIALVCERVTTPYANVLRLRASRVLLATIWSVLRGQRFRLAISGESAPPKAGA